MGKSKYTYNRRYFKNIDSEVKAYWLGFLSADACIEENANRRIHRIVLTLNPRDITHLEKFKNELNFSGNVKHIIRNYNHKNSTKTKVESAVLSIPGKEIIQDLKVYGCDKNKTKNLSIPNLPNNLVRHFIRGLFDGDGSINRTSCKYRYWNVQLSCNYTIATQVKNLFKKELDIDLGAITKMRGIYTISKAKQKEVKTILDYLYKDSSIYLDRKHFLYQEAIKML